MTCIRSIVVTVPRFTVTDGHHHGVKRGGRVKPWAKRGDDA
jgi:hypothetical protein